MDLGRGAGPQHWVITGDDAMAGLFAAPAPTVADPGAAEDPRRPGRRHTATVPALDRPGATFAPRPADGMQMSVDCADNAGLGEAADVAAIADPAGPA